MKHLCLALLASVLFLGSTSFATGEVVAQNKKPVRKYRPYVTPANPVDTRWAAAHSPWDFSGLLGLYNPGIGVQALGAYRVLNSVLEDVDDSLSVEAGIGYVGATNTYGGVSVSYSLFEIPVLARWDFRLSNARFVVGGNAGFVYMAGSNTTVNNVSYNTGTGLFFLIGGQGMYRFNDNWAVRVNIDVGGYTIFAVGATYFL
jgi:hypothetical protein